MSLKHKGLVFAMEEGEEIVAAPVDAAVVPAEAEAGHTETAEAAAEVAELNTAIEDAVEDTETLGEVAEVMSDAAEGGEGVDAPAAQVAEVAVESICRRLGIRNARVMPAMESFGSSNTRVTATRVAVEGITDVLKRAWEAIKNAFKTLWAKIVELWNRWITQNGRLKAAAVAVQKDISAIGNKKATAPSFDNAGIAKAFVNGGAINAKVVEEMLDLNSKGLDGLVSIGDGFEKSVKAIEDGVENATKSEGDKKPDGAAAATVVTTSVKTLAKSMEKNFSKVGKADADGFRVQETGLLINGKGLRCTIKETAEATGAYVAVTEYDAVDASKAPSVVDTLSTSEMSAIAKKVVELTTNVEKVNAKKDFLAKMQKTLDNTIDKAIKKVGSLDGNSDLSTNLKSELEQFRKATANLGSSFGSLASKTPALGVTAAKAALNYIGASMKMYKEEKA